MTYKQNLHTHTAFCDGKNTVEELVQRAIELGFDSLGFSGHIYKECVGSSMTKQDIPLYKQEVSRVKEKYRDQIAVWLGAELDLFADEEKAGYDYTIGSVHCLRIDGRIVDVDKKADKVKQILDEYFSGDGMAFAKAYYRTVAELSKIGEFDIVGHFDLVSKHCEKYHFFDDESEEYKHAALEALHAVAEKNKVFEVNLGCIARGYKSTPYPAPFLLKELKTLGCGVVLSSDCHNKELLDAHFAEGEAYVKSCGFDELLMFDGKQFIGRKI